MSSWPENKQFPKLSNYFGKLRLASPSIHKFVILRENLKLAGRPDDKLNDKNSLDPALDKKSLTLCRENRAFFLPFPSKTRHGVQLALQQGGRNVAAVTGCPTALGVPHPRLCRCRSSSPLRLRQLCHGEQRNT